MIILSEEIGGLGSKRFTDIIIDKVTQNLAHIFDEDSLEDIHLQKLQAFFCMLDFTTTQFKEIFRLVEQDQTLDSVEKNQLIQAMRQDPRFIMLLIIKS